MVIRFTNFLLIFRCLKNIYLDSRKPVIDFKTVCSSQGLGNIQSRHHANTVARRSCVTVSNTSCHFLDISFVFKFVLKFTSILSSIQTYVGAKMYLLLHVHMYVPTHVRIHTFALTHFSIHSCKSMYVFMYVGTYVHMYSCIHM
jgi:hypothetical protein